MKKVLDYCHKNSTLICKKKYKTEYCWTKIQGSLNKNCRKLNVLSTVRLAEVGVASLASLLTATTKTTFVIKQTPCQYQILEKKRFLRPTNHYYRCIYKINSINHNRPNMINSEDVKYLVIPDKSENDKKLYKTLVLANGLHVLLVSDPSPLPHDGLTSSSYDSTEDSCAEDSTESEGGNNACSSSDEEDDSDGESEEGDEKLAAVALLVDVGSFTEPAKYQGLAHFLEHMIFMGSKKYPTENAFDAHIKKYGGFDNANTECEETLFYFEVSEDHLDSSMDYFTALLKAPLMMKEAMAREREAVESEFQQTLYDDEARRDQLLASLANKDYPHSTFTWGNLKSLKEEISDDDLHRDLHEFCQRHYSGHRMYVCVQARLPIDALESLAVKHFSDIPSNNLAGKDFSVYNYRHAFSEKFHNEVFFVKPIENVCKLELTWVLPPMTNLYKCKPDHFLSYLIGYEGEGSLCAYLRRKLWGLELIAGVDESGFDTNSIYSLFNLCIYLTDSGFQHLDEVFAATFAYVQLFAHCGSLKEAYEELASIEATSFRFASQKPAFDNVQNLVVRSKYYPPEDILTGTELYYEYNEEQVKNVIKHLNEFTFNIMITSQQKYDGITYDKKEKWFGTEYTSIKMPQKWQDLWQNCKPMPELFLPKPNCFVSQDFRLFWVENGKPEIPLSPKKILQTDVCELWFRQDDKFQLPDAFMYFYFVSPLLRQSAKNDVLCALYAQLVKYRLAEELYPATVAGLSYQYYSTEKGVVLKVNGYNEKMHLVIDLIIKAMVSMREHITEQQLQVFKKHQKKAYFNALIKPKALNKDIRLCIVENIRWPIIVKYRCLNEITLNDMLVFAGNYTKELYVQTLMQGNLTEEAAHNVMNSILTTLNCQNIKEIKYIENRTVQLPQGSHYIRCNVLNDKDCNTVVTNFYQIGPCSVRIESILDLLMMFVEEPLFDSLRTKEQLGYYVASSVRVNYGIAGYSITVNSQETKNLAAHVEERIEAFRGKMLKILEDMPQDEFEHVRESLIKIKQVVDMSLYEEVARNWGEITSEEYLFDRKRKEVDVLRTLGKQEVIDFCLNNERTNLRKLSIQVIGHADGKLDQAFETEVCTETTDLIESNEGEGMSTELDDEEANEELFNALENKLNLKFIPRDGDATTIVDINDFKENLHVFPITKTKLESPVVDTDNRHCSTSTASMDIIEDC